MFNSIMNVVASLLPSAQEQTARRRGLYYPPEGGEVYASHREWAGAQPFATPGIAALAQWVINPSVHRCRIGKITLKQTNG